VCRAPIEHGDKQVFVGIKWYSTHLSNVDVGAIRVDLRVIRIENGSVDTSDVRDGVTRVVGDNNVRGRAVLTCGAQTNCLAEDSQLAGHSGNDNWAHLANAEVGAGIIDDGVVDRCKLVTRAWDQLSNQVSGTPLRGCILCC
jgi:hypothetical protein